MKPLMTLICIAFLFSNCQPQLVSNKFVPRIEQSTLIGREYNSILLLLNGDTLDYPGTILPYHNIGDAVILLVFKDDGKLLFSIMNQTPCQRL